MEETMELIYGLTSKRREGTWAGRTQQQEQGLQGKDHGPEGQDARGIEQD